MHEPAGTLCRYACPYGDVVHEPTGMMCTPLRKRYAWPYGNAVLVPTGWCAWPYGYAVHAITGTLCTPLRERCACVYGDDVHELAGTLCHCACPYVDDVHEPAGKLCRCACHYGDGCCARPYGVTGYAVVRAVVWEATYDIRITYEPRAKRGQPSSDLWYNSASACHFLQITVALAAFAPVMCFIYVYRYIAAEQLISNAA